MQHWHENTKAKEIIMRKILSLVFILLSSVLFAETIYLKDGTVITGEIASQDETTITVETSYGILSIDKKQIERIDYAETNSDRIIEEKPLIKNSAFVVRPLAPIITALAGGSDFIFEGQTAFSKYFALNAIVEFGSISGVFVTCLNVGPQYNINGNYLNGLYIGAYPGYIYATNYYYELMAFSAMFELGYQGVTKSGFTWGTYVGYLLAPNSGVKFGLKIGWAFPDMLVRIHAK
jgi:hypothetical protein